MQRIIYELLETFYSNQLYIWKQEVEENNLQVHATSQPYPYTPIHFSDILFLHTSAPPSQRLLLRFRSSFSVIPSLTYTEHHRDISHWDADLLSNIPQRVKPGVTRLRWDRLDFVTAADHHTSAWISLRWEAVRMRGGYSQRSASPTSS